MKKPAPWQSILLSDTGILILLAVVRFATLFLTNGQSGWHRDELDTLDSARHLAWGYVAYPPVAPFIARVALDLFGPSLIGVRFFSTLGYAIALVLVGLMARDLGGGRWAQITAAVAAAIAPYALMGGELFHYSSFDYLWWVIAAFSIIRLLTTGNPRWWLAVGAAIGVGMMTKYTMIYLAAGIVVGVIATRARRFLSSPWLWGGVALSLLIVLPNLIWQLQHDFISLDFLRAIHARDVLEGRAEGFLVEQLIFTTNIVTVPLWLAGLVFYFVSAHGREFRIVGWMFLLPLALFVVAQGRSYYLAPAYPMLFAGGAVLAERWMKSRSVTGVRIVRGFLWAAMAVSGAIFAVLALPIAPVNSPVWNTASGINGELKEEIGWPELVQAVADVYAGLPADDRQRAGILAGNYGEAGAIDLYGPAYGLPEMISAVNSYWLRGYGDPPPETLIVLGMGSANAYMLFDACRVGGRITNRYGVMNEETRDHPVIYVCRAPRLPWPVMWERLKSFG
jgi:4-amino-4-deoxy-L-arabinose transferase-like glycosyltransferase